MANDEKFLNAVQSAQEEEYAKPYHWFYRTDTESGRSYFAYVKRVAELIPEGAFSVLDVGSGDGRAVCLLKEHRKDISFCGSDYSSRALTLAAVMSNDTSIRWQKIDLLDDAAKDERTGPYDAVTAIEVFEHIPPEDLESVLVKVRGFLRPGGKLILTVPSVLAVKPKKHYRHFTVGILEDSLKGAGFKVESIEGQELASRWYSLLYKFADNRYWCCKPFMRYLNTSFYTRFIDRCDATKAYRLIAIAVSLNDS